METLVTVHSAFRWVVLVAIVGAAGLAFARRGAVWAEGADRPFVITSILFDIQLAIGIVLWIGTRAWDDNVFIAAIHPVGMLAAAGVLHAFIGRARKEGSTGPYRTLLIGLVSTAVLVVAAIPWAR